MPPCRAFEMPVHRRKPLTTFPQARPSFPLCCPPPQGPSHRARGVQDLYRPDSAKLKISYSCRPIPGCRCEMLPSWGIPGETAMSMRCARILRRAVSRALLDVG